MPDTDDNETKSPSTGTDEIQSEVADSDTPPRSTAATGSEPDGENEQNATPDTAKDGKDARDGNGDANRDTDGTDGEWVKPIVHDRPQHLKGKDKASSFALPIVLAVAIAAVLLVRMYVVEPYIIPSESMDPTIEVGDMVLGEKLSLKSEEPKRGDIVFFKNPDPDSAHGVLVKRVVAVGGQTVDLRYGKVYIDGVKEKGGHAHGMSMPLEERYLETDVSFPYTVPEGYIWVMGDNRENSLDSRSFGAIPIDTVYAESWIRYWPFNRIGTVE